MKNKSLYQFVTYFLIVIIVNGCKKNLHEAVVDENIDRVKEIVEKGNMDINQRDVYGRTALHRAAFSMVAYNEKPANTKLRAKIAEYLIQNGADVNARSDDGKTPLHMASASMNYRVAEMLLKIGAEINAQDLFGMTPLHEAASRDRIDMMDFLIEHGADMDIKDKTSGETVLFYAVEYYDDIKVIDLLVEKGAKVNVLNDNGKTALDYADDEEIARLLKANGGKTSAELASEAIP